MTTPSKQAGLFAVVAVFLALSCGGRLLVDSDGPGPSGTSDARAPNGGADASPSGGRGATNAGGTSGAGGSSGGVQSFERDSGSGGVGAGGSTGDAGSAAGGAPDASAHGAEAGVDGNVASGSGGVPAGDAGDLDGGTGAGGGGGANDAGAACVEDRDCPRPPTVCAVARCARGTCTAVNARAGTVIPDVPGDCHDVICDGAGGISDRPLDENNVPVPDNLCMAGTCNTAGVPGLEPLPFRTPCGPASDGRFCAGKDACVQCLSDTDCAPGLTCAGDLCIFNQCSDRMQDGFETDADCGGPICLPCDVGGACSLDSDCQTEACDAITHSCVLDHCGDHQQDATESDVDCGGVLGDCARCGVAKHCVLNSDCRSGLACYSDHVCG